MLVFDGIPVSSIGIGSTETNKKQERKKRKSNGFNQTFSSATTTTPNISLFVQLIRST